MPRPQETKYRLIYELSVNPGRMLSNDHLMSRVWAVREDGQAQVVQAYVSGCAAR